MSMKNEQMNTCSRKYYIETEKNDLWSIQGQINTHKRRYYTETENNMLP